MKPTLNQVFTLSLIGLTGILALLFWVVFEASRNTVIESSARIRGSASRAIVGQVTTFLEHAPATVRQFQMATQRGLIDPHDGASLEHALLTQLLADEWLGEVTFTTGEKTGFDEQGEIQLAPAARAQWSVWRVPVAGGDDQLWSAHTYQHGGIFVADRRPLQHAQDLSAPPGPRESETVEDPTAHDTFTTPARANLNGRPVWSDLHWSQLDAALPEARRRVEVSVLQAVTDADGHFVGVLRVGLLAQQLDRAVQSQKMGDGDPHRIFICDAQGRLITQGETGDHWEDNSGDLRVAPASVATPIARALADPRLRAVTTAAPSTNGSFQHGGEEFLTTFRMLPGTQEWIVGIVVPGAFYLGKLTAMRNQLLAISLGITVLLVTSGGLVLRSVKRAQAQIVNESMKMNAFEFCPSSSVSAFRDVSEVLESLEKAKAAMRAMGKYAPLDLVRRLYREKSEPVLGGAPVELSIMFTDIKDFTTLAEQLAPNELAAALGRYLEVMAHVIQQDCRGTIDKYVGDAIMTIWNAPEPVPEHSRLACLAALHCRAAGRGLAQTPAWRGMPAFETRFGLHRDTALVGHFGAPDRMNYAAIGDAVNLASRLEGLNKSYGTTIIVSEHIVEETRAHFDFRLLDWVAVKGKAQAVKIYELLGEKTDGGARPPAVIAYESAFTAYLARDFTTAMALLGRAPDDPPSVHLLQRCRALQIQPPPPEWRGIHRAESK